MGELDDLSYESIQRQNVTQSYLHLFAISILYYDHILTFKSEVAHLWARPKSHSSYWFFLNRYFAFFTNIAVLTLSFTTLSAQVCRTFTLFRQILLIVNQILVCGAYSSKEAGSPCVLNLPFPVLLTLRIYALYHRSKVILTYMLSSGAILAGISCYVMFGQKSSVAEQSAGCHTSLSRISAIRLAGAWEALFLYDSILFSLTLYKTLKERKDNRITGINIDLVSLILRDGCMYFAVMALCNLANILTFYVSVPYLRGSLSTFASSTSVTMMSRMMLNLHETADEGIYSTHKTSTHVDYSISQYTEPVELDTIWSGGEYPRDQSLSMGLTSIGSSSVFAAGENETVSKRK
ncbi:hypothetical protein DFP72DRAFT_285596 [Ephemerocybe angulata]|uniref:DUF6533 domain-containing protein n=1 Tax=Ephemerocybe angulata TaxID=980116 RepID=A0A8H6M9V6_9AGAR|nr:hypothetical protein DFP72DRAFT_285596 [Tulosesus angulatus]